MRKVTRLALAALSSAIGLTAVAIWPAVPAQAQQLTKVVFSLDFIPLGRHAPWYAALAEGYYKDEGLDVSIIPSQGGANVIQNVESGTATFGFMGVPEVAIARATGAKVKMVAVNYQKLPVAIFSLQSGANVTTTRQLAGLTLGSGSGSFTPKILQGLMTQNGLDPSTLHVVDIAPAARASALLTKKVPSIEFFVMAKPGLEQAAAGVHEKLQTFLPADHGVKLYSNGIGVREDYLAKNPDIAKGFVRASLKGWQFALAHPDKAAADELKYVPSLKPDVITAELEIVRALSVTPDVEAHGLGWFDAAQMKANLDFVVKYIGVSGTPPAATDLYATGFLPNPPIKP